MSIAKITASVLGYFADTDAATAAMQPFMKTVSDHIDRYFGAALDPHADMLVVGQGPDDSTVLLRAPGACDAGDTMAYKGFDPIYSTKLRDSYNLPVPGSLQPDDRMSRRRLRSGSYIMSGRMLDNTA